MSKLPAGKCRDGPRDGRCSGDVEGRWTAEKMSSPPWFDDGSVVLVAERTAFRVHSSLLSRHSPGLKKLFAVPRTSEAEDPSGLGCPVFHLSDTAEDLNYLLELIYPACCCPLTPLARSRNPPSPSCPRTSGWATSTRSPHSSTTLSGTSRPTSPRTSTSGRSCERESDSDIPFTFSENPAADAIDTVNLARTVETPSLLPVALYLYLCCQLDPADIMEGVTRSEDPKDTRVFSLSSADIALCFRARETLLKASANVSAISLLLYPCSVSPQGPDREFEFEFKLSCANRVCGISESGVLRWTRISPQTRWATFPPQQTVESWRMDSDDCHNGVVAKWSFADRAGPRWHRG